MITVPVGVVVGVAALLGSLITYNLHQDRRITRLEERVRGLGQQLQSVPKRRGDRRDDAEGA